MRKFEKLLPQAAHGNLYLCIRYLKSDLRMAGIYIHIPFCKTRCDYCAFYSTVSGGGTRKLYVQRLCGEIAERKDFFGFPEVSSVYLGGGTPSQLAIEELRGIFNALHSNFRILPDAEITMEVNPDDISGEYAAALHELPINRISMGVQSFNGKLLRGIHRRHSAAEAVGSYEILRNAGFGNISIDLIYALPGQTAALWEKELETAVALRPEHISAYALSFEEGTPLYARLQKGETREADEELYIDMYATLVEKLKGAGYEHYEISNFALPGKRARHNSSYWTGEKYLGLGAGAHSFDGISRRINLPEIPRYISSIDVPHETETLTTANKYDEMVMTRLRTCEGINIGEAEKMFGAEAAHYLVRSAKTYIDCGKMELVSTQSGKYLKLTESGVFVSDEIISDLMNPD